ncbi:uncharacterized protein [Argopecten irradians]|uniref:uncharacterized protein n=1 Tax=Argopecten irradians TaxID=31199 RepID=UPI00371552D4
MFKIHFNKHLSLLTGYTSIFLRGRPLDLETEEETIEGETSQIFVSRRDIFRDATEEISLLENIRLPIDVTFYGEEAVDFGGPRREFFVLVLKEIKDKLLEERGESVLLRECNEDLALQRYFTAGVVIGLSILEGGPAADFLDNLLRNARESEHLAQFKRGLERTGLLQLMSQKPSLVYLFRPSASQSMTVNKLLTSFKCQFSEEGSNKRMLEEATYRTFVKYTREVFAGRRSPITLEKILSFATSSEKEPALGFPMRPSLHFTDGIFATSNTCIFRMCLPLLNKDRGEDDYFAKLDLAFANSYFGLQ